MLLRTKSLGLVAFATLVTTLLCQGTRADDAATGYYGFGVSIGMAEFASLTNQPKSRVVNDLQMALAHAKLTKCVPLDEIQKLITATNLAGQSRDVYTSIRDYRIRMSSFIQQNCGCGGDTTTHPGPTVLRVRELNPDGSLAFTGVWTRRGTSNTYDAVWYYPDGSRFGTDELTLSSSNGSQIAFYRKGTRGYYRGTVSGNQVTSGIMDWANLRWTVTFRAP